MLFKKNILMGVVLPKENGKIPVVICEFKENEIHSENKITTFLSLEKILSKFPDKKTFLNYIKLNNLKIPYNKCWQKEVLEKMNKK